MATRAPPPVSEAVNAHENIYIDSQEKSRSLSLSRFSSFSFPSRSSSPWLAPAPSSIRLAGSSLPPPSSFYLLFLLFLHFRHSLLVSSLGYPLVPCCSSLVSSTNDGNRPQTHQLTLFRSYRTTLASPFFPPLPAMVPFSLSLFARPVSGFTQRAGHSISAESACRS